MSEDKEKQTGEEKGEISEKDKNEKQNDPSSEKSDKEKAEEAAKKLNKIIEETRRKRPDGKRGIKKDDEAMFWKKGSKTFLIWMIVIAVALILINVFDQQGKVTEIDYNQLGKYIEEDKVKSIEITNTGSNAELTGEFNEPQKVTGGQGSEFSEFKLIVPSVTKETADEWSEKGILIKMKREQYGFTDFLLSILPWVLFIFIWIYLLRRMQGGGQGGAGKGIFSFGKSKARLFDSAKTKITFKDVAGSEEAKEELTEVIDFLKKPERFTQMGAKVPKGVLLTGPPGTGKTLLAKAVAGEAGVPFFSISGADFVEMFVGVGASRVRDLFEQSKKNSPCILFIDELDAVGRHRGTGIGGGNDEREQTLNQLLVEMDGFETEDNVIIIAATNRPDVLDPALLRPGRFDRHVVVDNPDVRAREAILKVHAKKIKIEKDIDLSVVAKGTPGLSGADLASIINEAALFAARKGKKTVDISDVEDAKDKVMMGVERKSAVINDEEKKMTAYHEAGHVLIAKMTVGSDPVHKVTIIPRGRAMGLTHYLPIEEKHSYSKTYIFSKLLHLFGGRVAEELIFNDITTGASNDIERASDIARKMVCEWGMSDEIGPIHYGVKNDNPFLGKELTRTSSISEEIGKKIDNAVQKIIFKALEKTRDVLTENIETLHSIAEALLRKETLSGSQIDEIIALNTKKSKIDGHDIANGF
ncbi:MAG: ATP-dependent zinc metalloprotease FtsH [Candidatus Delongbacteria bacterium]